MSGCPCGIIGRRVGERVVDHADLGAVAVGDDDVGAVLDHVHDVLGGVPHELELPCGVLPRALPPGAMTTVLPLPFSMAPAFSSSFGNST